MELHLETLEFPKIVRQLTGLSFSAPGRELCEALTPVTDLAQANYLQKETSDATAILLGKGTPPLHGISDIRPTVRRAARGSDLGMGELLSIAAVLRAAGRLERLVPADGPGENLVYAYMASLTRFDRLEKDIASAIISDEEMADSASPKLGDIRRRIKGQQASIREALDRIIRGQGKYLQEALITQRSGRYVVPVKAEHKSQIPGIVHDASGSGQTLFIEPMAVVSANNKIRELLAEEHDEIEDILQDFSEQVAAVSADIAADVDKLAQIDFAIAKGRLALQMKAMPPRLNSEGRIHLKGARHPLIPAQEVVPIDLWVGQEFRQLVITGPNTGGKTVALKTCGLLTLMAMAGLEIPARENSEVSVFENVLADIGDEQSIEQSLSTFSSHMKNLVHITSIAGPDSLVLTDELGSGTDPSEGAALAMAILDHLMRRGCVTLATTHYKELKAYALQTDGVENGSVEFDTETLRPTYRLMIGVPGVSNAFIISGKLGLDKDIIDHARTFLTDDTRKFEDLIRDLDRRGREAVRIQEESLAERNRIHRERQKFDREKADLENRKSDIIAKAREEMRSQLREQVELVDSLVQDIQAAKEAGDNSAALTAGMNLRGELRRRLNEVEGEIGRETLKRNAAKAGEAPEEIIVGESYYAPALNMTAKALSEPDSKGMLLIQAGSIQVRVSADSLVMPETDSNPDTSERDRARSRLRSGGKRVSRSQTFRPEIKLLGQSSEEALINLDHFLDDAVLAGAKSLRIVHGKGSGILRKAVQDYLKKDRRVSGFRLAAYGEGDTGVTIAELK